MPLYKSLIYSILVFIFGIGISVAQTPQEQHSNEDSTHGATHDQHGGEEVQSMHGMDDPEEEFQASEMILHHILDTHDWHITDIPTTDEEGNKVYKPIAIHLPWFFYSSRDGLMFVPSSHGLIEQGYMAYHEHLYALKEGSEVEMGGHGEHDEHHLTEAQFETMVDSEVMVIDLSLTKASLQMLLIGLVLIAVFGAVAQGYAKRKGSAPKGLQSFFEPLILFIRDDIARPNLGDKADRFLPYLLTLFFFIWFSNLFGFLPFNSNIMGNISVTAALAFLSFLMINVNGSKDYWRHIFATPGVPVALLPLMLVVELIGVFTKPFALAVRLFANISAGHFMLLSLVSLLFIFGEGGKNVVGAFATTPLSVIFPIAIFLLEMIVAIIQAYIFTLLTAVFVGMAMESHDDHH